MYKERIFLGLLGARGDCVFATTLARQIKADYPDSHLVWGVSKACKDVLLNNPDVDEVWAVDVDSHTGSSKAWMKMMDEIIPMIARAEFNHVYLPQINPANYHNYDGTIRPSLFRAYGKDMTVPIESVMVYGEHEKENVDSFISRHGINEYKFRILFECTGGSGQTFVNAQYALDVAKKVALKNPDACLILSSSENLNVQGVGNIVSAHELSFRENGLLAPRCTHFVGCGSGISALIISSDLGASIPNLQLLKEETSVFASFFHDLEYWGKSTENLIEMRDVPSDHVSEVILEMCRAGTKHAKAKYHQPPVIHFKHYSYWIIKELVKKGRMVDAARSVYITVQRYGWHFELLELGRWIIEHIHLEKELLRDANEDFVRTFLKSVTKAMLNK